MNEGKQTSFDRYFTCSDIIMMSVWHHNDNEERDDNKTNNTLVIVSHSCVVSLEIDLVSGHSTIWQPHNKNNNNMMFTYMQCFPVLFSTYDCIRTSKDQIIDLKGEYLKKILCGGCQENVDKLRQPTFLPFAHSFCWYTWELELYGVTPTYAI